MGERFQFSHHLSNLSKEIPSDREQELEQDDLLGYFENIRFHSESKHGAKL